VELDWLETYLAVVDRGGFTAASAQVHRSQSRVSAHIAALERELGVLLIDRSRRPASVTPAGRIFASHARDILADVRSARSAIGVLRAMDDESLAVLTTPCIGAALFPEVLAKLLTVHPRARVALSEHGWQDDDERRHPADGFVLAVLPTLSHPQAPGMQERLLWREPMLAVVPAGHELTRLSAPSTDEVAAAPTVRAVISPAQLVGYPLVVSGMSANAEPEVVSMLADRGLDAAPRTTVDAPQTLVAMVRTGVGIGIANAVALDNTDTAGVVLLGFDDPEMIREVAAYWYDELLVSEVGRAMHQGLLDAALPRGAVAIGAGATSPHS
jgi:DNA-binding transcriptional LysR family regulator